MLIDYYILIEPLKQSPGKLKRKKEFLEKRKLNWGGVDSIGPHLIQCQKLIGFTF